MDFDSRHPTTRYGRQLTELPAPWPQIHCRRQRAVDGYFLLRGFLDQPLLAQARDAILAVLHAEGCISTPDHRDYRIVKSYAADLTPRFRAILQRIVSLEAVHDLLHLPQLHTFFSEFYGEPVFVMPAFCPRISFPIGPGKLWTITTPHQEYGYFGGDRRFMVAWIPLDDCSHEMGPVRLAPGSHKQGLLPMRLSRQGGLEVDYPEDMDWASAGFKLGDLLAFDSHLVHASTQNVSDRIRLSIDLRLQPLSGSVLRSSLPTTHFIYDTSIEETYRTFRKQHRKYYWLRAPLDIVDTELPRPATQLALDLDTLLARLHAGDVRVLPLLPMLAEYGATQDVRERAAAVLQERGYRGPEDIDVVPD
jgi:hypothetical protein